MKEKSLIQVLGHILFYLVLLNVIGGLMWTLFKLTQVLQTLIQGGM